MLAYSLLAALDDALETPLPGDPTRSDRLALALRWLIESVADEFDIPPERAADEVATLCGLVREMIEEAPKRN